MDKDFVECDGDWCSGTMHATTPHCPQCGRPNTAERGRPRRERPLTEAQRAQAEIEPVCPVPLPAGEPVTIRLT